MKISISGVEFYAKEIRICNIRYGECIVVKGHDLKYDEILYLRTHDIIQNINGDEVEMRICNVDIRDGRRPFWGRKCSVNMQQLLDADRFCGKRVPYAMKLGVKIVTTNVQPDLGDLEVIAELKRQLENNLI